MPLSDDQLRAIGRISVAFNNLELATNLLLWALVNRDQDIGRLLFAGENFDRVLTKIDRLGQHVTGEHPDLLAQVQNWSNAASDVQRRRNEVIHSVWTEDEPTGEMIALRLTRREPLAAHTRATELDQLADDIERVLMESATILSSISRLRRQ